MRDAAVDPLQFQSAGEPLFRERGARWFYIFFLLKKKFGLTWKKSVKFPLKKYAKYAPSHRIELVN